jgi:hypothetical protein
MFRRVRCLLTADSPFRYGKRVAVAPHVKSKDYGREVLLFASPTRLNKEALDNLSSGSDTDKKQAYWEIYNKRVCESVHLLDGETMINIIHSLEVSPTRDDSLVAFVNLISNDVTYRGFHEDRFGRLEHVIGIMDYLVRFLPSTSPLTYTRFLDYCAGWCQDLQSLQDAKRLVELLISLKSRAGVTSPETRLEKLLLSKVYARCQHMETFQASENMSEDMSLSRMLDVLSRF